MDIRSFWDMRLGTRSELDRELAQKFREEYAQSHTDGEIRRLLAEAKSFLRIYSKNDSSEEIMDDFLESLKVSREMGQTFCGLSRKVCGYREIDPDRIFGALLSSYYNLLRYAGNRIPRQEKDDIRSKLDKVSRYSRYRTFSRRSFSL